MPLTLTFHIFHNFFLERHLAGSFNGVQHIKGDAGKYQQDIPGSGADSQGHWKPKAVNEWIYFTMNAVVRKWTGKC